MNIIKTELGKWVIVSPEGEVISEHDTNAQAWKALDRIMNEPISKREDTADWSFRKASSGE